MLHWQKAGLSVWHLHPGHAFDAVRDFNDPSDEKDAESSAAVISHRMTRILGTGRHEQALHGTFRHVDPNPSIAFEDLRNASPTDGLGDGGTQQGLSWIKKEERFDDFAHRGRHSC